MEIKDKTRGEAKAKDLADLPVSEDHAQQTSGGTTFRNDCNGHGTHVAGTIGSST